MNWFVKNILFFILTLLPILLGIICVFYIIKTKKISFIRIIRKPSIIVSSILLILLSLIINLIVSAEIEKSIYDYYNNMIGQPINSSEKIPTVTTPWYSLIPVENSLLVIIEDDTVRGVIIH